ncbi:MAG: hypothetical protein IMY71_07895 [Bacteroidetes bacterium]|nr:hypothetical protein [Bacteroidota bacterium]
MKKLTILLLTGAFLLGTSNLFSQECVFYSPVEKGTVLKYSNYDKKDKLTGTTTQTVIDNYVEEGVQTVKLRNEYQGVDMDSAFVRELEMKCKDGKYYVDMESYIGESTLVPYSNMETTFEVENMTIPAKLKAGEILDNGRVTATISHNDMKIMTISVNISNRKVEAKEDITTPAGTFECYKISYDISTKMIITIKASTVEWYAKNIGVVRTESYNKKGKLTGYTLLTGFQK